MDPVTKILIDREHARTRLLPWIVLAIVMHAGVAAATYLVGRRAASRPVQLPVVSVKIVRPQAPNRRAPSRQPERRATAVPQPTKAPPTAAPESEPVATAPPKEDTTKASADAMRAADSVATPAPTPRAVDTGGGGWARSLGGREHRRRISRDSGRFPLHLLHRTNAGPYRVALVQAVGAAGRPRQSSFRHPQEW